MRFFTLFTFVALLGYTAPAQYDWAREFSLPEPAISWDSLRTRMMYPEIYVRAGINALYIAKVAFDSLGNLQTFRINRGLHFYSDTAYVLAEVADSTRMDYRIISGIEDCRRESLDSFAPSTSSGLGAQPALVIPGDRERRRAGDPGSPAWLRFGQTRRSRIFRLRRNSGMTLAWRGDPGLFGWRGQAIHDSPQTLAT